MSTAFSNPANRHHKNTVPLQWGELPHLSSSDRTVDGTAVRLSERTHCFDSALAVCGIQVTGGCFRSDLIIASKNQASGFSDNLIASEI